MRIPTMNLKSWAIVIGWILVVGGIIEAVDLLYRAWTFPAWSMRSTTLGLLEGPFVHVGLGLLLWTTSRR